jgi:hypothetical protein
MMPADLDSPIPRTIENNLHRMLKKEYRAHNEPSIGLLRREISAAVQALFPVDRVVLTAAGAHGPDCRVPPISNQVLFLLNLCCGVAFTMLLPNTASVLENHRLILQMACTDGKVGK